MLQKGMYANALTKNVFVPFQSVTEGTKKPPIWMAEAVVGPCCGLGLALAAMFFALLRRNKKGCLAPSRGYMMTSQSRRWQSRSGGIVHNPRKYPGSSSSPNHATTLPSPWYAYTCNDHEYPGPLRSSSLQRYYSSRSDLRCTCRYPPCQAD